MVNTLKNAGGLFHKRPWVGLLLGAVTLASGLSACDSNQGTQTLAPQPQTAKPEVAKPDAADSAWKAELSRRRAKIDQVISQDRGGFDAYDIGSLGDATLEMIPYVVFRVLQEIEPGAFGKETLHSVGFFGRKDVPSGYNGITWTQPIAPIAPEVGSFQVRYFTRTCAGCHTGRIRLDDGERIFHGGGNPEIRLHYFVGQLTAALKARLGDSNGSPEYQAFKQQIADALAKKEPGWYWGAGAPVTPEDAQKEVQLVLANLDAVLGQMRMMNQRRLTTLGLLQKHSYDKVPNPPSLTAGAPGIIETAGLGASALVPVVGESKAGSVLPPGPSKADVPAVWQLDPNGYANWDGTVKGFSRALTSSLAVVGNVEKVNFQANKDIQAFLAKLPVEPFPFKLDPTAVKRGEAVYKENCVVCHDPAPGRSRDALVFDVQSDPARAIATLPVAAQILQKVVSSVCPKDQECLIADPTNRRGYSAASLAGTWAQAPYLHNGSVPTLRQLLVPSTRTTQPFLRGSISYDAQNGGWEWDPAKEMQLREKGDVALTLHDTSQAGMATYGHGSADQPYITVGDKKLRIAWTDGAQDKPVVDDLIAYLLSL